MVWMGYGIGYALLIAALLHYWPMLALYIGDLYMCRGPGSSSQTAEGPFKSLLKPWSGLGAPILGAVALLGW